MGGFTNLIYFRDYLSEEVTMRIKSAIESYGESEQGLESPLDIDLLVKQDGEIYAFRFYYTDTEEDLVFDEESQAEFLKKIGYIPKCYLGFMAWKNRPYDDRFIAQLMAQVLEIEPGLIDFCARIDPDHSEDEETIRAFVSQISGRLIELEYINIEKQICFRHLADKEFLKNWISHERFYIPF